MKAGAEPCKNMITVIAETGGSAFMTPPRQVALRTTRGLGVCTVLATSVPILLKSSVAGEDVGPCQEGLVVRLREKGARKAARLSRSWSARNEECDRFSGGGRAHAHGWEISVTWK